MSKEVKVTYLNDYRPVALMSVAMKCFEKLVMAHINSILPNTLNPLQFAYCPNRSIDEVMYTGGTGTCYIQGVPVPSQRAGVQVS